MGRIHAIESDGTVVTDVEVCVSVLNSSLTRVIHFHGAKCFFRKITYNLVGMTCRFLKKKVVSSCD